MSQAWLVLLALRVNLAPKDLRAAMEVLDFRVSWVPKVRVVPLVKPVVPASLAHQVRLVLLVLLESHWATGLRC